MFAQFAHNQPSSTEAQLLVRLRALAPERQREVLDLVEFLSGHAPPRAMPAPLTLLLRGSQRVWLRDAFAGPTRRSTSAPHADLPFGSLTQAQNYLNFWLSDAAALLRLRYALGRCAATPPVASLSNPQVLAALAAMLVRGSLRLTQETPPASSGSGWPAVAAAAPAAGSAAAAAAPIAKLTDKPIKPPVPPLLPLLETLQIEGAEVLPEIEQTLAQIDLTLAEINLAGVSLEPTPSKVPLIQKAIDAASGKVSKTLSDL